jgi:hypothetical protein
MLPVSIFELLPSWQMHANPVAFVALAIARRAIPGEFVGTSSSPRMRADDVSATIAADTRYDRLGIGRIGIPHATSETLANVVEFDARDGFDGR